MTLDSRPNCPSCRGAGTRWGPFGTCQVCNGGGSPVKPLHKVVYNAVSTHNAAEKARKAALKAEKAAQKAQKAAEKLARKAK